MTAKARPMTAFTLFCDDVRQEVGGKLSAMGIYQGFMGISADEVLLPKLVAWTVFQRSLQGPGRHGAEDRFHGARLQLRKRHPSRHTTAQLSTRSRRC